MKDEGLLVGIVINADQRNSRRGLDEVPTALSALAGISTLLPFERTTGDEVQGLLDSPEEAVIAVLNLVRLRRWRIGVGIGSVDVPLPPSTRQARGNAYLAGREAINEAGGNTVGLAVRGPGSESAQAVLWLVAALAGHRSAAGWELSDLLDEGMTQAAAAARLGISPSAVSQRSARAHLAELQAGTRVAADLLRTSMQLSLDAARVNL